MGERVWLVAGASGGVGAAALARLRAVAADDGVHALSRSLHESTPGLHWHAGDLGLLDPGALPTPTHVASAGPLDAFSGFAGRADWPAGTVVVALSSMSASTKAGHGHRLERAVARRLLDAEAVLAERSRQRCWKLVVLRPTLIWGAGDRSITPLLSLARRTGVLPLPRGATGLRQPVHAQDLAQALVAAALRPEIGPGPWPAPGGEVLGFDEMLRRALAAAVPGARMLVLPDAPSRIVEGALARLPGRPGRLASQLRRARADLHLEAAPLWSVLGIQPRGFQPDLDSFPGLEPAAQPPPR